MAKQQINFEEYAQLLSKSMTDAVARAEVLQAEAVADRDAAHNDEHAKNDLLHDLENKAQRAAEDEAKAIYKRVQDEMSSMLAERLKKMNWSQDRIEAFFAS